MKMKCLTIDIGGTFIKYGLVDDQGEITQKGKMPTPKTNFYDMAEMLKKIVTKVGETDTTFEGVALSIPAPVDVHTGIIHGEGSLPFLLNRSLKTELIKALNVSVSCENDGNCAALAEVWAGAGKAYKDMVLIVCGTGIGGAIVKDRKIHHGKHLYAGEFGYGIHQYQYTDGKIEIWSDLASTGALVRNLSKKLEMDERDLTGEIVFNMASEGNALAEEEVDRFFMGMAIGIHNIQYYYDPELILLGGAISARVDFIEKIEDKLTLIYESLGNPKAKPNLSICQFENDANLVGAAYHFRHSSVCNC
jgi:predicted NBD/HSP70 family sugar kinase